MKRTLRLLAATAITAMLLPIPPSSGQEHAGVTLTLLAQTPWNTPKQDDLDVKILVHNEGDQPLDGLTLDAAIFPALLGRDAYVASLTQASAGTPLKSFVVQVGHVDAGADATVRLHERVDFLAEGAAEGRVYPLDLNLLQGSGTLGSLYTPVIFIPKEPKQPLELAWSFVLSYPTTYEPNGVFLGHGLERAIAPGGALDARVSALEQLVGAAGTHPVDVAVGPVLLDQLVRMQRGYKVEANGATQTVPAGEGGAADAASVLDRLKTVAAADHVKLSALPATSPSLPRLLASGLGEDLPPQIHLGQSAVQAVLGTDPDPGVLYPPGSAIDDKTLGRVRAQGVQTLILDPGVVEQPRQDRGFAPPPATILAAGGGATIQALTPEEGTQALMTSTDYRTDPRLRAQAVLGDLASVWLEQPDSERGIDLIVPGEDAPETGFLGPFTRTVASAPWITTHSSEEVAKRFASSDPRVHMNAARPAPFPDAYVQGLQTNRALVAAYRSILVDPTAATLPAQLDAAILTSQENALVNSKLGPRWVAWTQARVSQEFAKVRADPSQVFTLTSRQGSIPLRLTNTTGQAVNVRVRLVSTRLQVTGENPATVTLGPDPAPVSFSVQAQTTGTFPVQVVLETPGGYAIGSSSIVVRSTAYSRVALVVMGAAALTLIILWVRRLLSTRKR